MVNLTAGVGTVFLAEEVVDLLKEINDKDDVGRVSMRLSDLVS